MATTQTVTDVSDFIVEVPTFTELELKYRNKEFSKLTILELAEKELKLAKNQLKEAKNQQSEKKLKFYVSLLESHVERITKDIKDDMIDTKYEPDEDDYYEDDSYDDDRYDDDRYDDEDYFSRYGNNLGGVIVNILPDPWA